MSLSRIHVHLAGHSPAADTAAPFSWLAGTARQLFRRLSLPEPEPYLETRRQQGLYLIDKEIYFRPSAVTFPLPGPDRVLVLDADRFRPPGRLENQ